MRKSTVQKSTMRKSTTTSQHAHSPPGLLTIPQELRDIIYAYLYSSMETIKAADEHTRDRPWWSSGEFDTGVYQTLPEAPLLLTCKQLCSEGGQYYERVVAASWGFETIIEALTAPGSVLTEWHYFTIDVKQNKICNNARFALRTYRVGPRRVRRTLLTVTLVSKTNYVSRRADGTEGGPVSKYRTLEHAVFGTDTDEPELHGRDGPFVADCSLLAVFSKIAPECSELYGSVIAQALRHLHGAAFAATACAKARYRPLARIRDCLRDRQPEVEGGDYYWKQEDEFELAYGDASHDAASWAAKGKFRWDTWSRHTLPMGFTTVDWTRPKPVTLPEGIIVDGFEADEDLYRDDDPRSGTRQGLPV